jgi:hypothetical protein
VEGLASHFLDLVKQAIAAETGSPAGILNLVVEALLLVAFVALLAHDVILALVEAGAAALVRILNFFGRRRATRTPWGEPWVDLEPIHPAPTHRDRGRLFVWFTVLTVACPITVIVRKY